MTPEEIAAAIMALDVSQLEELKRRLDEWPEWRGEGGAGVREPVGPAPESPGDAIAADLPEDYWETAQ